MHDPKTVTFDAETHQLVPKQPTAEILAGASIAVWPTASAADIALARDAALIAMKSMDAAPGVTLDMLAATIATMAPAYRAMLAAAPTPAAQSAGQEAVITLRKRRDEFDVTNIMPGYSALPEGEYLLYVAPASPSELVAHVRKLVNGEILDSTGCPARWEDLPDGTPLDANAAPVNAYEQVARYERDDTGRITSSYEPSPEEIQVCRDAICREFGNNGTDGYYIRILKAVHAVAAPVNGGTHGLWDVYAFGKWQRRVSAPVAWDAHTVYLDMVKNGWSKDIELRGVSSANYSAPVNASEALAANFACYLIDHCEGETVTEEGVQRWLTAMLANPQYAAPVNGGEREHLNVLLERCAERLAEYGMQDCVRSVRGMKIPNDGSPVEHAADAQARGLGRRRCAADAQQVGGYARAKEVAALVPILRGMIEGGSYDDPAELYAADFGAPDGDVFVRRAADLLEEYAALTSPSKEQE